jgi:adenylate cyclase class 2
MHRTQVQTLNGYRDKLEHLMNMDDHSLEIEVKFHLNDPSDMQRRLRALGAAGSACVFESNRRYEDLNHSFKRKGQLLRLRQDSSCKLTFKSQPGFEDADFKVFNEIEVSVDSCTKMNALLQALGFRPVQVYEKWRETYVWKQTHICLDSLPFGDFIEIEGNRRQIKTAAERLGLPWQQRIKKNYLSIFEIIRQKARLSFKDVTFSNFKNLNVSIDEHLPLLLAECDPTH